MPKRTILIILLILILTSLVFIFKTTRVPILSDAVRKVFSVPRAFFFNVRVATKKDPKIQRLERENEELKKLLIDYGKLKRDNQALRDQFENSQTREFKLLPAKVLGQNRLLNPSVLILDQGERAGVKKGMAVVLRDNLLGKIETASLNYSKVNLSHHEDFSTLARTNDTNAIGLARGTGDFILFGEVSINDKVNQGQLLLTGGDINSQGFGVPPDLVIGEITSVNRNESLPTQSAKIEGGGASGVYMVFIVLSP